MHYGKIAKMALAGVSMLGLSSCLSAPGTFTSDLTLLRNGSYQFSYDGEIQLVSLAMMMGSIDNKAAMPFEPYCDDYVENGDYGLDYEGPPPISPYVERDCTKNEIAEQREQYDAQQASRKKEQEQMRAALGGIDPTDPATIDEFAERLEKQAGWQSVEHLGNALFKVSYRTSGQLPDNFGFPLISDVPTGQPFITVARWKNGNVRIDAPLFIPAKTDNSMTENTFLASGLANGFRGLPERGGMELPQAKGSFTIRTDGEVLTNNTDDGPKSEGGMKVLSWNVGTPNRGAPQALIGF